jgi:hypothetical protein
MLRKGGRVVILDWRSDVGHPPGPPLDHRIPVESTVATLQKGGWETKAPVNVGRYSYLVEAAEA